MSPTCRRRGEGDLVGLLEGAQPALVRRRGAAQYDERHGALGGDVHRRDCVRERGSGSDDEYARLPPRPAPGRGREARRDLVAAVHHLDALPLHRRHDLDHGSRHHPEGRIDAGRLQLSRDDLSAVHICHAKPSVFGGGNRTPRAGLAAPGLQSGTAAGARATLTDWPEGRVALVKEGGLGYRRSRQPSGVYDGLRNGGALLETA